MTLPAAIVNPTPTPSLTPSGGGRDSNDKNTGSSIGASQTIPSGTALPTTTGIGTGTILGATATINGQPQGIGSIETLMADGRKVTTVTVDGSKIQEQLNSAERNAVIGIRFGTGSGDAVCALNGQIIKNMENRNSVLEIRTENVSYTLPATSINIDNIYSQFGGGELPENIVFKIKIADVSEDGAKIIQDTANKNNYQMLVKPVDFEITCSSGGKTVSISKFNGYVERMIAIPEGVDPSKITTGIVLNIDGTFSHAPTTITQVDGKYFAKINSLTNSTYTLIWNSATYTDTKGVWAETEMQEVAARLILKGENAKRFNPEGTITRGDFTAALVKSLGLKPSASQSVFKDVKGTDENAGYIMTALEYGLIKKDGKGMFNPSKAILQKDMMEMILNGAKITKLETSITSQDTKAILAKYSDVKKAAQTTRTMVVKLNKMNIMSAKNFRAIRENQKVKRSEAAYYLIHLLKVSKLIN